MANKVLFSNEARYLDDASVFLLLNKGHSCYRPKRSGKRKHKSVHGALWIQSECSQCGCEIRREAYSWIDSTTVQLGSQRASQIKRL